MATLRGQSYSRFLSNEVYGVVSRTGSTGGKFSIGDHVICLKGGNFDSEVVAHSDLCLAFADESQAKQMLGFATPFSTAIYGLIDLGRLRRGEVGQTLDEKINY